MKTYAATLPMLLVAALLAGCKPDRTLRHAESTDSAPVVTSQPPVANAGSISGVIHFDGVPPQRVPIDMSMDPACAMAKEPNASEQVIVNRGHLANVFVSIRAGAPATTAAPGSAPVVMDQKGCRFQPHVIALQQGGSVQFINSDPTVHNVHSMPVTAGDQTIDLSEQPGMQMTRTFSKPETMMPVRCNNHPWMNAFINVATTPYFAVTTADGSFRLTGLPPGQYTLGAVHETLGDQQVTVTVPPNGNATADFTFKGR